MTAPSVGRARWLAPTLIGVRLLLLIPFHAAFFNQDSGEYLFASKHWTMFYDRPAGVSFFYRIVLTIWRSPVAIIIGQSILGVLAGLLLDDLLRRRGITSKWAAITAVAGTMNPVTLYYERAVMSEALSLFLLVLTVWCLFRVLEGASRLWWIASGLSFGALVLTRSAMTPLFVVIALVALMTGTRTWRARLAALGLVVLGALVCLAPYTALMADKASREYGTVVATPTSFDGIAFFAFVASLTDCGASAKSGDQLRAELCRERSKLQENPLLIPWTPGPVQSYIARVGTPKANVELRNQAIDTVVHHPFGYAKKVAVSTAKLFGPVELSTFRTDPSALSDNRRLPKIVLAVLETSPSSGEWSEKVMRYAAEAWMAIRLLLLAATVVLVLRWRVRPRWDLGVLWAFFLVPAVVTVFVTRGEARYLEPFEPLLWAQFALLLFLYRPSESLDGPQVASDEPAGRPENRRKLAEPA